MLTFTFFNTDQILAVNTTFAGLVWERPNANFHPAPTIAPVLDLRLGANYAAAAMGRFQIGQLLAQVEAQLPPLGEAFGDPSGGRGGPLGGLVQGAFVLADLGWTTGAAAVVETARIFTQANYAGFGRAEAESRLDFTISALANGDRTVAEHPIVTTGDTIEIVSDAVAGNNVIRFSLERITEEGALVAAVNA